MTRFRPTVTTYKQGARTLTREEYTDPAVFERERERIFSRSWVCVGRADRLARPGEFMRVEVAGESLLLIRDEEGGLRALFNVCRHRGSRLCHEASGRLEGRIRCAYHGWTYGLDGALTGAPHMAGVEGFDLGENGLHQAAVEQWEGFVFVNLDPDPAPFERAWAPVVDRFRRFGLWDLRTVHEEVYDLRANWKLVFENFNECLHCPLVHPQLDRVVPYDSGANDLSEGPFLGGHMEIRSPHESGTMSGRSCGPLISQDLPEEDRRRAYFYSFMPNLCLSVHPDYVVAFFVQPLAADRTRLVSTWLFHKDVETDASADPQDAIRFWDLTNRQDWAMVEGCHQGVSSRRWTPGAYSARESLPAAWDEEYRRWMDPRGEP